MGGTQHQRGFTLIELLVVIAIIAILAAILFPVFLRVKERGRAAACVSNMRQIGTAIQHYVDDFAGTYPDQTLCGYPLDGVYDNTIGYNWIHDFSHRYQAVAAGGGLVPAGIGKVLRPYLKNLSVFKCPSEWRTGSSWGLSYDERTSYYYKHALCYFANRYLRPTTLSVVRFPSKATLMYEEAWHSSRNPYLWAGDASADPNDNLPKRVHSIFIDCHVGQIDVPFYQNSGYAGHWYFYLDSPTKSRYFDISKGARDLY